MELVLPQADKMIHALKKLHIVERCFRTGAERKAAPSALHESKGIFSFAKENMPLEWECLPSDESKRFVLLLSPLPLCLRFGSLQQFPPTLDCLALLALAAVRIIEIACVVGGR